MISTSALAADTTTTSTTTGDLSTNVKYHVDESYSWSIHSDIDFDKNKAGAESTVNVTADNGVKINKNVIGDGKKLSIKIKDDQAFEIKNGSTTLTYKVYNSENASGTALKNGDEVVSAVAGTNEASTAMTFVLTTNTTEVAGDYTGTIAYTASIVDK